jgi:pseudouridylate synthase
MANLDQAETVASCSMSPMSPHSRLAIHESVRQAIADGRPVVALESTISSNLGLPTPYNREVLDRCIAIIEEGGGIAAVTAVIDGIARVGLDDSDYERVLTATRKCAERDLPVALAERWDVGVTTVSATVALAAAAGVKVFATGGMGGVHRDDHLTGDVSADLGAIARHPVIVVTAGAKAFLDLAKTSELLDTLGVPVLGYQTDEFPAFYSRTSGIAIHRRIDDIAIAAKVLQARIELGIPGGVVVANPIPAVNEITAEEIAPVLAQALSDANAANVRGAALTPYVLGRIAQVTEGRSIPANLALAANNARVATMIAASFT